MKKLVSGLLVCAILASNVAQASFPVKSNDSQSTETVSSQVNEDMSMLSNDKEVKKTSKFKQRIIDKLEKKNIQGGSNEQLILLLLWLFLAWPFAAHRWYAQKPIGWNILFILTFGGLGIWALVDGVKILMDTF
jgi:hypothetical protein